MSNRHIGIGVLAAIGLIFVVLILSTFYTVNETERGVVTRNGAVTGIAEPGFHFAVPFVTNVKRFDLTTRLVQLDKEEAYSRDQQPAEIKLSVNYRVSADSVQKLYTQFGSNEGVEDRLIRPRIYEIVKTVFGGYTAVSSVQDRGKLNADVRQALANALKDYVIIEGVQIEDISYGTAYEQAIAARMQAEVLVTTERQNLERERVKAQIAVTQAQAQADSKLAEAKARAEAIKLEGDATAAAITARSKALQDNPGLIELTKAERWDGKLPTTMLPNTAVPFFTK